MQQLSSLIAAFAGVRMIEISMPACRASYDYLNSVVTIACDDAHLRNYPRPTRSLPIGYWEVSFALADESSSDQLLSHILSTRPRDLSVAVRGQLDRGPELAWKGNAQISVFANDPDGELSWWEL